MTNPLFAAIDKETDEYRREHGLEPLNRCPLCAAGVRKVDGYHHDNGQLLDCTKYAKPELCDCGKPATYLSMCNSCYHSAQISSKEEHSPEAYRRCEDD